MLDQSRLQQQIYLVLLDAPLSTKTNYNYLVLLPTVTQSQYAISIIIDNQLTILLQPKEIDKKQFFKEAMSFIGRQTSTKHFHFTVTEERILAKLYKELHLPEIKKWFLHISKTIVSSDLEGPDLYTIHTFTFELNAYNQSEYKYSHDFYFIELILQYLEKRIAISTTIENFTFPNNSIMQELLAETDYNLCFSHIFPDSKQSFGDFSVLSELLQQKLQLKGIKQLYTFQIEAIKAILEGRDVVITAPTGNGKTESFLLPIIQKISNWKGFGITGIKSILLYPTKALASDQLAKIRYFTAGSGITLIQLDSDVSQSERKSIYASKECDILITTPDLIHYSLQKKEFQEFIIATRILVFDEIHTYAGTFGTHIYYFLRRLERVLSIGRKVQYITASATIANPVEFTSKLFQREMFHVDCNTPKKNATELYCIQRAKTVSKYDALFQLVSMLTQSSEDEKIIIFRNSQQESEKTFEKLRLIKNKEIALHRAGLSRDQRLLIEKELRDNEIDVVVTTTTLEVGIDIGGITTIITPIVPVNRLLQRIGRAGRGQRSAKIFLELGHDPISYYYANHADSYLQDISPVNITTENESIAFLHNQLEQALSGKLFSLRNVNDVIEVRTEKGYKVTEKELPNAFYEYYPFAQLLQNSKVYRVERMEQNQKKKLIAIVRPTGEKYDYKLKIRPLVEKKVFTNKQSDSIDYIGNIEVKLSECKIQLEYQGNLLNYKEHILTDTYSYEYTSRCVIFNFEDLIEEMVQQERENRLELGSIVHTLAHVLYKAAKMIIYCGNDLTNMENSIGMWKIVFVDNAINGNGMSELLFSKREEIWERAMKILDDCTCGKKEGCIKCTMDYGCQRKNKGLLRNFKLNIMRN